MARKRKAAKKRPVPTNPALYARVKAAAKRIQDSQKIHGIAPVPFLTQAVQDSMKHLDGMGVAIVHDISDSVEQFLTNIGYKEVNGKFELIKKK